MQEHQANLEINQPRLETTPSKPTEMFPLDGFYANGMQKNRTLMYSKRLLENSIYSFC
jgi:hypothetical protein